MAALKRGPWFVPLWRALLLALELCGAAIILRWSVPFYRELLAGNFSHVELVVKLWGALAIVLIQTGYWIRYFHRAIPSLPRRIMLGHLSAFAARLNFIFTGGLFSAVFFIRYDQVIFTTGGVVMLFSVLFSMFCVTLDLERVGAAYLKGENPPAA
ncbi:MAG: hypothetical protein RLZZ398_231 [Verrucomicrobiota bacterium]|jgi:hypothetical protein